jgi:hypothetical protein
VEEDAHRPDHETSETPNHEDGQELERKAVSLIERAAPVAALVLTASAVDAAAAFGVAAATVAVPVFGTAVASLIPLAIEAARRRQADHSQRTERAQETARRAWIEEAKRNGRGVAL